MNLHFGILGPLEVRRGDVAVELGPPKQKAVLAALLISANQVVSLDRLIEMLWGEDVPARAPGSLQAYIHNLRKALEPDRAVRSQAQILVTRPPGYVMQVEPNAFDATMFEILAGQGHRLLAQAHPGAAQDNLKEALALWRGPALAEFAFESFAQPEAARLEEARVVAHEDLLEAELALGNHAAVIGDITVAVGEHPLRERLWSLLMLALYRSGRQGEALRAFAMARHTLAEDLGIDPSPTLRSLEAAILAQSPELDFYRADAWSTGPPTLKPPGEAVLVRAPKTVPLVGRETELRSVVTSMARARIGYGGVVLISGEAGIGKTRLAEEAAAEAERDDSVVAWGRAYEPEGAPSYWLWNQVVGELVRRPDPQMIHDSLRGRPGVLRQLLPDGSDEAGGPQSFTPPESDSPPARFAWFEAVTGFLVELAEACPMLLVLEDLQWADRPSLQLLEHMAPRFESGHVLILGTCRPLENYRESPLTETIGALARLPSFDWIELDGLNCLEVGRMVAQSGARLSPAQVTEIHTRTEGNPFFVANFARLLARRDIPRPSQAAVIPNNVRVVIQSWLRRLPDQTHQLLVVAAAMGRQFDIRTVASATNTGLDDALDWVQSGVLAGVVIEDALNPGMYRFGHRLVQDTLLCELSGLRRSTFEAFAIRHAGEPEKSDPDGADRHEKAYR